MATAPPAPKLPNRHRALAELDRLIERAELDQVRKRAEIERIVAEGREPRRAAEYLGFASTRLAQLHKSRETLLAGEAGDLVGRDKA